VVVERITEEILNFVFENKVEFRGDCFKKMSRRPTQAEADLTFAKVVRGANYQV